MSTFPLAVCYLAFPVSSHLAELSGVGLWRNWIDLVWAVALVGAALAGPVRRAAGQPHLSVAPGLLVCAVAGGWVAWGLSTGQTPQVTAALEAKPVFYLLVALLFTRAFGAPSPQRFSQYGSALAVMLLVETALRSAMTGTIVRPVGSGEVNYDGALLCLAFVFALSNRALARTHGPVIFLGLLASFSRTGLLAASGALLFATTVPVGLRLVMMGAAAGAGVMSFVIRGLEVGALEGMDRYWMWAVGLEYLLDNPWKHALGVVPGSAVDVEVPRFLADLWLDQQESVNVEGIYPFHFHAMWLRLATGWGWALASALAVWLAYQAFARRHRAPFASSYFVVFLVLGLTMGLLYLGNVAVPFLLAMIAMLQHAKRRAAIGRAAVRNVPARPSAVATLALT